MMQVSGSCLTCEKCMNWELHTLLQRSVDKYKQYFRYYKCPQGKLSNAQPQN